MPAVGKTKVAQVLARHLGVRALGGSDALRKIARKHGYNPRGSDWWDTKEGISFLMERKRNPKLDKEADGTMLGIIKKGNIIVTSYTMPWLSRYGIKVWLSASRRTRAARMAKRDRTSVSESRKVLAVRDRENTRLYEKLYGIRFGSDKKPFDIILDTTKMGPMRIAGTIIRRIHELDL